ncbi:MAG: hypothetical protein AAFP89_26980, partial [Bacteroidota bacterium]
WQKRLFLKTSLLPLTNPANPLILLHNLKIHLSTNETLTLEEKTIPKNLSHTTPKSCKSPHPAPQP